MNAIKDMLRQPLATLLTVMVIAISPDAAERVLHRVEKRQHRGQPVVSNAAADRLSG